MELGCDQYVTSAFALQDVYPETLEPPDTDRKRAMASTQAGRMDLYRYLTSSFSSLKTHGDKGLTRKSSSIPR